MHITASAYHNDHDKMRMAALVRAQRQDHLHIIDLPYRLSSWAFDDTDNICLWEDAHGDMIAWAVIQTPFWAIDYAYHPIAPPTLHQQILTWADARLRTLRDSPYGRPMWFVNVFDWQHQRQHDLDACGWASQANVGDDSWSKVFMLRSMESPVPDASLPSGFTIRPLHGVDDVDAYVALHRAAFESKSMTAAWRRRTLQHADYRPELDLVAVDPHGQLAAFCVCWFAPSGVDGRPGGQIEPLGVRADMRRRGLGQALLVEGVRRLYQHGAEQIAVETDNNRNAAFTLYEAVGLSVAQNVLVYRKDYASTGD